MGIPIPEGNFTEDLNTRISDDCKVRVLFDGPVTQEAIEKLKRYLDLIKDDYPTKKAIEPPKPTPTIDDLAGAFGPEEGE
jgi:hypothetical protein